MGLITALITLPLAPVRGVAWVAEQVAEAAEHEPYDEQRVLQALARLEEEHEAGAMDDETFAALEEELLERLEVGRGR